MREILFLSPIFHEKIWGGDRLKKEYGYDVPSDHTGECWAISAHPQGDSKIIGGTYDGETLDGLWKSHRELFGNLKGEVFPLLIKLIDAKEDLSIQVHPDDLYAKEHENGALGKMECWYILDCEEGADIVIGHHAKTQQEMRDMIEKGRWEEFIRIIPIKKGDFFQINPGCLHAIRGGTLLLETQQNSDVTYRVYDYNRLENGKPRQLHLEKSMDVITVPFEEETVGWEVKEEANSKTTRLVTCSRYYVDKVEVTGEKILIQSDPFLCMSVVEGEGTIDGVPIQKGVHMLLPSGYGEARLEGIMTLIVSSSIG